MSWEAEIAELRRREEMARQMGGDAPLMAGIVALTTAASLLTIPALLILFHLP